VEFTRSSATADGPRDAPSVKIFSTAACTSVETSCTTNPEQVEVLELEGYSRPTCSKLCATSSDASTVVGAIHKLDRGQVLLTTRSTCSGEIFKVQCFYMAPHTRSHRAPCSCFPKKKFFFYCSFVVSDFYQLLCLILPYLSTIFGRLLVQNVCTVSEGSSQR